MRGHRGPAVGEHELRAVADHAPPLEVLAGVEARRVDERDDRQVERVAERHEPSRLLRGRDVERAGERDRLVGDDPDGRPPIVANAVTTFEAHRPRSSKHLAVVDDRPDHVAHVVAAGRRRPA